MAALKQKRLSVFRKMNAASLPQSKMMRAIDAIGTASYRHYMKPQLRIEYARDMGV
jgi:hypothetical protein